MSDRFYLSGTSLAGHSPTRSRAANDFYATPFETTKAILDRVELHGSILEPAAGQGHISKLLMERYPDSEIVSTDLVEYEDKFGCGIVSGIDFLTHDYGRKFNNVITNGRGVKGQTRKSADFTRVSGLRSLFLLPAAA